MAASVELDAAVEYHGAPATSSVPVASGAATAMATVEALVPSPTPPKPRTSTRAHFNLMDLPDEVLIFFAALFFAALFLGV